MKGLPAKARVFVVAMAAIALACLGSQVGHWSNSDIAQFICYTGTAMLASGMKVALPGIDGTMSVSFLFVLLGMLELSLPQTLILGCASTLVQSYWQAKRRPKPVHVAFNVSQMAIAIYAAYWVYQAFYAHLFNHQGRPLALIACAIVYFVLNTAPVACVISMTEHKAVNKVWSECYFWSFPYYLVGAGMAGTISFLNRSIGWEAALLVLPAVYVIFRSYRLYLSKLEDEKRHVEDMAGLHLRTIEALALAIEAKQQHTHDHLQRVRVYAVEVAKELGLGADDIEALRAAALLHDIGKLAVPEHIISKPGRLTPEEFEKMKIHPLVGAEILEQVKFPYDVVPIVRAHHEKWDGSGYPFGLKDEQIPVGARILAAVDCLDALASDRQYRRALPLDDAMCKVVEQAGTAFDPQVVDILKRRYIDLEQMARAQGPEHRAKLSTEIRVERGEAPATGFAPQTQLSAQPMVQPDFLSSIAAARQEVQTLLELSHDLGNSLSIDETLSVLSVRSKRLVPYDSIAIYIRKENVLVPEFVSGDNFRLFSSLELPVGQGLSARVAQTAQPIVHANPPVEPDYLNDPTKFSTLRSALAVPLEGASGCLGVLALYKAEPDAFTSDHVRILLAITSKIGLTIENALKFRIAETSATTDYLTGLPNARSLFLHLDQELSRARRSGMPLVVLVCDLDGFKQINDRFGHLEGNRALRMFAASVRDACREYDYVARMGGDEFVLVAPGMQSRAAMELVRRLEMIASQVGRAVCNEDILSVSVGQAAFPADGSE